MQRPGVDRLARGPPTGAALRPRPLTPEPPLQALRPLPLGTLSCTPCLRCSWGGEPSPWALGWGSGYRHPSSCPTQGRFTIAAKHHISIAEIYETELVDIEKVSGSRSLPGCSSQSRGTVILPSVMSSGV